MSAKIPTCTSPVVRQNVLTKVGAARPSESRLFTVDQRGSRGGSANFGKEHENGEKPWRCRANPHLAEQGTEKNRKRAIVLGRRLLRFEGLEAKNLLSSVCTYSGQGPNNDFSTAANWEGGVAPGSGDTADIPAESGAINVAAPATIDALEVQGDGDSLQGTAANPLTIGSGSVTVDSGTAVVSANLAGSNGLQLNGGSGATLQLLRPRQLHRGHHRELGNTRRHQSSPCPPARAWPSAQASTLFSGTSPGPVAPPFQRVDAPAVCTRLHTRRVSGVSRIR